MGKLIEADALLASLRESRDRANVWLSDCREYGSNMTERAEQAVMTFNECILRVKGAPTVDAVPVRHGEWISHKVSGGSDSIDRDTCSECGRRFYQIAETGCLWNYCPNCGADMRKEGEQDG